MRTEQKAVAASQTQLPSECRNKARIIGCTKLSIVSFHFPELDTALHGTDFESLALSVLDPVLRNP